MATRRTLALNLYGVTFSEAHEPGPMAPDTELVVVRDLAAICGQSDYTVLDATPARVAQYTDVIAIAAESLRVLRRSAVTTVPLRLEKVTGIVLSAAFLVEHDLWKEFSHEV